MLTVDRRERTLIALLPEAKSETLALGDIVCHGQDNEIKFIAERKTVADLSKSICDGRFNEQKGRLMECGSKVLIIVEGDFRNARLPYDCLLGACAAAFARDDCPVFRTMSINETATTLRHLAKHACSTAPAPTLGISKRKRDEDHVFIRMLMCIPSFSESVARAIADHFGTVGELRTALQDLKSFPEIRINPSALLGKARIKRLAAAFS